MDSMDIFGSICVNMTKTLTLLNRAVNDVKVSCSDARFRYRCTGSFLPYLSDCCLIITLFLVNYLFWPSWNAFFDSYRTQSCF